MLRFSLKLKIFLNHLKKNGGFIPGIRPGEKTKEFLDFVVARLTLVGGVYIFHYLYHANDYYLMLQRFLFILVEHHF